MSKQEVIRKAYNNVLQNVSEKYKKQVLKNIVNDGWCEMFDRDNNLVSPPFKKLGFSYEFSESHLETKQIGDACYWRPKSLAGIETNNFWIKIESEADLPKDSYMYWVVCSNGDIKMLNDFEYYKNYIIPEFTVTHYQPITKPLKPIY